MKIQYVLLARNNRNKSGCDYLYEKNKKTLFTTIQRNNKVIHNGMRNTRDKSKNKE